MSRKNKFKNFNIVTPILTLLLLIFPYNTLLTGGSDQDTVFKVNNKNLNIGYLNNNISHIALASAKSQEKELELIPGGQSVGVKITTKGVLVVGFAEISSSKGTVESPGWKAGIAVGDSIIKVNDIAVENTKSLINIINKGSGKEIKLQLERNGEVVTKNLIPVRSEDDENFKIGLWVRDSTAGVGTLTFYDPHSHKFGALGHPITDVDTNSMLKISSGMLIDSSIINIKRGEKGNPGELKGIFVNEDTALGKVNTNTACGIFGTASEKIIQNGYKKPLKVASQKEIKEGKAKIITTIDESGPKLYDIEIVKLLPQDAPGSKSMIIKITDSELLSKTGGIVQGMSGSPILQNDKIIGAVTHVLVNKPDTGYGIYIHWMIKDANILSK
ncbi:SpoIVB peptidase [Clostridium polynesiense]|uniref:SpoIVB peptidase n=1 Tax=Clostridium polynesiense TaxID=1325933 RepID=UPI00058D750F|nr:SpoIVB peptidase [Clostridium polynesiense]